MQYLLLVVNDVVVGGCSSCCCCCCGVVMLLLMMMLLLLSLPQLQQSPGSSLFSANIESGPSEISSYLDRLYANIKVRPRHLANRRSDILMPPSAESDSNRRHSDASSRVVYSVYEERRLLVYNVYNNIKVYQ